MLNLRRQFQNIPLLPRRWLRASAVVVVMFVLANCIVAVAYNGKTWPKTYVGTQKIGSVAYNNIDYAPQLQRTVTVKDGARKYRATLQDYGVVVNRQATQQQLARQHRSIPLLGLVRTHKLPIVYDISTTQYTKTFQKIALQFNQSSTDARIVVDAGGFTLQSDKAGKSLSVDRLRTLLLNAAMQNSAAIQAPFQSQKAQVAQSKLQPIFDDLAKRQKANITLRFQAKKYTLSGPQIAALYTPDGLGYTVSKSNVQKQVDVIATSFGIRIQNKAEAVDAIMDSLAHSEALDFTLVQQIVSRTYTYCVKLKAVDQSYQAALETKLASTYADTRGWSLGGSISFVRAQSGCNFTVWLAAADQMASFGSICDATWSCAVSPNVIINFDRWTGASSAWNASGGSLDDYRTMVINHETGHWLGFGHRYCSGAGQVAPVMQQQSIDLQGCRFNPWPTAAEQTQLRNWLGI